MPSELFSKALVNDIRVKFETEGLGNLHTNELLVLVTDHFSGRLEAMMGLARPLVAALWVIALSAIAGLISGLIVAVITLR